MANEVTQAAQTILQPAPAPGDATTRAADDIAIRKRIQQKGVSGAQAEAEQKGNTKGAQAQASAAGEANAQSILSEVALRQGVSQQQIQTAGQVAGARISVEQAGANGEQNIALGLRSAAMGFDMLKATFSSYLAGATDGFKSGIGGTICNFIGKCFGIDDIFSWADKKNAEYRSAQVSIISPDRLKVDPKAVNTQEIPLTREQITDLATAPRDGLTVQAPDDIGRFQSPTSAAPTPVQKPVSFEAPGKQKSVNFGSGTAASAGKITIEEWKQLTSNERASGNITVNEERRANAAFSSVAAADKSNGGAVTAVQGAVEFAALKSLMTPQQGRPEAVVSPKLAASLDHMMKT